MQNEIFSKVKDPRVLGKVKHELEDVLRIALIGVLCSCEDYDEISDLIEDRAEEFRHILSSLKGCQVIIDGKKLRGGNPTGRGCNGPYILNAMVSDHEICVEEERVEDKTNGAAIHSGDKAHAPDNATPTVLCP